MNHARNDSQRRRLSRPSPDRRALTLGLAISFTIATRAAPAAILPLATVKEVPTRSAFDEVPAPVSRQLVFPGVARYRVVAGVTQERVVPFSTEEEVMTAAPLENVIPAEADELVGATETTDDISSRRAHQSVRTRGPDEGASLG